jgi:MFS family permease
MTTARIEATSTPGMGRRVVAALWGAALMPYLTLAIWVPVARATGTFASVPIPAVVVLSTIAGAALAATVPRLAALLPESLDDWLDPRHRKLAALWAIGSLVALVFSGRIAVFLGDPSHVGCSLDPRDAFLLHHSCLTAYIHGAILSTDPLANAYDVVFVNSVPPAPLPPTAAHFAPFQLDAYGYPPPFLLLPRAMLLVTRDFLSQRMVFAAGSILLAFFSWAATARTLGGAAERRLWLLTPLFLANPLVLVILQVGNFHLAAVSLCLLCWVALERQKDGLTGALLAVAALAKIFPALLGVVLLMQRRWRAVGYTVVIAAALCALSVALLGTKVWHDFVFYHLPKVQSGEAFQFMAESDQNIEFNLSFFGVPFKLGALGLAGWGWAQTRMFSRVYAVLLVALTVLASRNQGSPRHRLSVWLAVVMLGSLQSPFAATFVAVTMIMLLLAMTTEVRGRRDVAAFVATLAVFSLPVPGLGAKAAIAVSLVRMVPLYAFLAWVALRREKASEALSP